MGTEQYCPLYEWLGSNNSDYLRSFIWQPTTDTRVYELDCGKLPIFWGSTGRGCGGPKPLEIGDVIHFRTEKGSAYISLPDGSEQKLRILNEELRPEVKSTDEKPVEVKQ